MTVRLRAHHLLCVLTYVGKGYSPAFTANFDAIAARLAQGEAVRVVEGPDDICAPLLQTSGAHCHCASVAARDRQAARDVGDVLGTPILPGRMLVLDAARLQRLRAAFASGRARRACCSCLWHELCDRIAAGGYREARVADAGSAAGRR